MPGRQTRFHNVEASSLGARPGRAARRAVPIANGEEMLRRYIEGVGKGQPDYEHMTSEVADITRQQLPFDQAILARLGALRAVSFRGVTALDSDIYVAQFANGSAEWRIGCQKRHDHEDRARAQFLGRSPPPVCGSGGSRVVDGARSISACRSSP